MRRNVRDVSALALFLHDPDPYIVVMTMQAVLGHGCVRSDSYPYMIINRLNDTVINYM